MRTKAVRTAVTTRARLNRRRCLGEPILRTSSDRVIGNVRSLMEERLCSISPPTQKSVLASRGFTGRPKAMFS